MTLYATVGVVLYIAAFITCIIVYVWFITHPRVQSKLQAVQAAWTAFKDHLWNWATAWLYQRDLTKRRTKNFLRSLLWFAIGCAIIITVVAELMFSWLHDATLTLAFWLLQRWISLLEASAILFGLNAKDFATYVSADLIVVALTGILGYFIVRRLIGDDSRQARANLMVYSGFYEENSNGRTFKIRVSNLEGEDAAEECRAVARFWDIDKRDIIDHPNKRTVYRSTNFKPTLRIPLIWESGERRWTIESGEEGLDNRLNVLRIVNADKSVPAHFEIPTHFSRTELPVGSILADYSKDSYVCLRIKHYYGKLKFLPRKGKRKEFRFQITNDEGGWYFDCGEYDELADELT